MNDHVIAREEWRDVDFSPVIAVDDIENGLLNDLLRCGERLRTLGYAHLDANARHLIAETCAPRIREMREELMNEIDELKLHVAELEADR